jgi:hypothetical protein
MVAVLTYNVVPENDQMLKYERLGEMAVENRRLYCERHGYTFIDEVAVPDDRPVCWAKIPAILQALENHEWVLWADSDTLILDRSRRLEDFCDTTRDLVVQSHDAYFEWIGVDPAEGRAAMPINTGVFLIRATDWSRRLLEEAWQQDHLICRNEVWSGIGEQEAIIEVLQRRPEDLDRIHYVEHLQNHPKLRREQDMFVHLYGHYSRHYIPPDECEEVFARWEAANANGTPFPDDIARLHWCAIQNKDPRSPLVHGDLERYLYSAEDIGLAR